MQFSAVLNMFIVKTYLNSIFTNDLKRKENFSKNVQSYRVCSFKLFSLSDYMRIFGKERRTYIHLIVEILLKKTIQYDLSMVGGLIPLHKKFPYHFLIYFEIIYIAFKHVRISDLDCQ